MYRAEKLKSSLKGLSTSTTLTRLNIVWSPLSQSSSPPEPDSPQSRTSTDSSSASELSFNNDDFYDTVLNNGDLEHQFAPAAGLATCVDIDTIKPFLPKSGSILEVGSGYGRVIGEFADNPRYDITGLERNETMCAALEAQYDDNNRVAIVHENLTEFSPTQHYDIILWLWSGLCDFPPEEQLAALLLFKQHLKKTLVVDIPANQETNATSISGQLHTIQTDGLPDYQGYVPGRRQMEQFAIRLGLGLRPIMYRTDTGRLRCAYLFSTPEYEVPNLITDEERRQAYEDAHSAYTANRLEASHPTESLIGESFYSWGSLGDMVGTSSTAPATNFFDTKAARESNLRRAHSSEGVLDALQPGHADGPLFFEP